VTGREPGRREGLPTPAGSPIPLGPGGEFDRIRGFLEDLGDPGSHVLVGPGDDAAVLEDGLVISTDLSVEGIHFRLEWIRVREAGRRAASAALSDLAAMAAEPLGILASVAAPEGEERGASAAELMAGIREAAGEVGAPLLGGDLTRSPGPLLVDVVVLGRAGRPLLRSGALEGDELWVTGTLGAAAGAVALWRAGAEPPASLRNAFVRPRPRIQEAIWLVEAGARAGLDLSDGLAGDAGHLAASSGVRVTLVADAVPVAPALAGVDLPRGQDPLDLALHGGEDYELLVAAAPGILAPRVEEFVRRFDLSLTRVGIASPGREVAIVPSGGGPARPVDRGGFDHFHDQERA
jgi:thiamine-monophosphate kinase